MRRRVAAKRLEFIEHPLWRTYIFVYAEGEALLESLAGRGPGSGSGGAVRAAAARAADAGGGHSLPAEHDPVVAVGVVVGVGGRAVQVLRPGPVRRD